MRAFKLAVCSLGILAGPLAANDFRDAIFAPIRSEPGTFLPPGCTLNAPVITAVGVQHGKQMFEVAPAGNSCNTPCVTSCPDRCLGPSERVGWASLEYLYWATQGPSAPPFVTTGPAILGPGIAGVAGNPTTQNLLGGERMLNGLRPGFRASAGLFLDSAKTWAISHESIALGSRSERLVVGSNGTNVVNLPKFANVLGTSVQLPLYVGFPGITAGTVAASVQSSFYSGDALLRRVYQTSNLRLDLLAGYRFLHVGDSVSESFDIVPANIAGPFIPRLMGEDSVRTRNFFHGGEVGFSLQKRMSAFAFEMQSTIALGGTTTEIDRSQTRSPIIGTGFAAIAGGALPVGIPLQTNSLTIRREFAVVPQVGFKLGWQPLDHVRIMAGYDILYWSRVRRAQDLFTGNDVVTDFWAQGLSLGAELRY